jgi:bifunctional UDP-N-acetylglucosamine pyrophosphorylase / glucosamine-1-phosphate N-acetyltransferase
VTNEQRLRRLKSRGVAIIDPRSTHVAESVNLEWIEPGAKICGGCRISGKRTFIGKGTTIGRDGLAVVEDCAIGRDVELQGGSFRGSVFLDRSGMGPGAHVRAGCLLEEEANGAHTVGLKQTILFPFVTLGSLINFCDCLMAGGTSLRNHGEVGSSYIHFNFTPNQDKATPSLIGDVPRGVMLDRRPVFLGGQGGLVGPARVGFGSVIAAGIVCRADVGENALVAGGKQEPKESPYREGIYIRISRKVRNNISYIANLAALKAWYAGVRSRFLHPVLLQEAVAVINGALAERVSRLKELAEKMPGSAAGLKSVNIAGIDKVIKQQNEFQAAWPKLEDLLRGLAESNGQSGNVLRDDFLNRLAKTAGNDYISVIQALDAGAKRQGTAWLSAIVAAVENGALAYLPSY